MIERLATKVPVLRRILCAALVGLTIWCSVLLHRSEVRRSAMKTDLKEISHITYGLFNVDRWRADLGHHLAAARHGKARLVLAAPAVEQHRHIALLQPQDAGGVVRRIFRKYEPGLRTKFGAYVEAWYTALTILHPQRVQAQETRLQVAARFTSPQRRSALVSASSRVAPDAAAWIFGPSASAAQPFLNL